MGLCGVNRHISPYLGSKPIHDGSESARWYDRRRVILTSFLVGLVLVLTGLFVVSVRGVALWRDAKRVGRAFEAELGRFDERAVRTERLLAEADRSALALQAAQERLRISHARLEVLLGSIEDAKRRTRWLRLFLPPR